MLQAQTMFDCFVSRQAQDTIALFQREALVNAVHALDEAPFSTRVLSDVAQKAVAPYTIIYTKAQPLELGYQALHRILCVAEDSGASILYADHYIATVEGLKRQPLIDYQKGSIRDDFQMGSLLVLRTSLLKQYFEQAHLHSYQHAGLYDLRLFLSREMLPVHIEEYLYTEVETDLRKSGEKQFDYVDPRNQARQKEMERAATRHLRAIGAYLSAGEYSRVKFDASWQGPEASVIIPVRNRVRTIADAVRSAAAQQTTFPFNIIVIDNHSTDGTSELLDELQAEVSAHSPLIVLRPTQKDLGIGGCWNLAIHDERCGRFAVQLDSDDLYSSPETLQRIVDKFHEEGAAMVIGSYRMCNFQLETLPPGIIDHREWTDNNGRNNALRINGLGAPRAFYTPILRQRQIPNTSYGEDYALGLMLSRSFRISRIYDELYLCRRWEGNSDAALEAEAVNRNNHYKDFLRSVEVEARQRMMQAWSRHVSEEEVRAFHEKELENWQEAAQRYEQLAKVERKELTLDDATMAVQWNPARIVSTGSKIDKESIAKRPCFLCDHNRPAEQHALPAEKHYQILVNPFPILPGHLTIITRKHQPQQIYSHFATLRRLAWGMGEHIIFYNGAHSGASCPDHCHLQAGERGQLPLERDWTMYEPQMKKLYPLTSQQEMDLEEQMGKEGEKSGLYILNSWVCPVFVILSGPTENDDVLCKRLYEALPVLSGEMEPRMNAICWRQKRTAGREDELVTLIFPRKSHRPMCYPNPMVSPGALDMGGLLITPQEQDFRSLTAEQAAGILREVSLSEEELQPVIDRIQEQTEPAAPQVSPRPAPSPEVQSPEVSVGILSAERVSFCLNGDYRLKGESITGEQEVTLDENGLNWQGQAYSELTLRPLSDDSTFTLRGVTIGKQFHWQRQEEQTFQGKLRLVVAEEKIFVINKLPVEQYLKSVISSEMKATCPPEFLKASAVISRSWLMAQMQRRQQGAEHAFFQFKRTEEESIRWHDQEEHTIYDVCADDHCQRYQGVTRATSEAVNKAVEETAGRVLTFDGEVCDARFAKCCGGVTNDYENCWENEPRAYLAALRDMPVHKPAKRIAVPNLSDEAAMRQWVMTSPESACNTTDQEILSMVLNDYDQETTQFYRWTHTISQAELQQLLTEKMDLHLGDILALEPVERGRSGHLVRLRIRGTERSFVIGKELEIRRVLSPTHLLSSAFVVDVQNVQEGVPQEFVLHGAGWGHGVGMCQIGAAVMGSKGYTYDEILQHYYQGAEVSTLY